MGGAWLEQRCPTTDCIIDTDPTLAGQAFGVINLDDRLAIGGTGFLGNRGQDPLGQGLFGAGGFVRYALKHSEEAYFGLQLGGGWLYGQVGVPLARKVGDRTWLYAQPAWGSTARGVAAQYWPVGLSFRMDSQLSIHGEIGAETHLLSQLHRDYNLVYGSIGVSVTP